ncbi:MAG: urea ABC transporter [Bradyrhizobiaceae bacterium]|nr:MAG: urea ABC transporter [Bradyrhizobiaceae bacterium]
MVPSAWAAQDIKLGSLLDLSGNFDAYGKPMSMGLDLALDQINKSGGIGQRKVVKVGYDTQSDIAQYTKFAQQLVRQDKVDLVVGGILSASREAIRPLLHRANMPYFYTPLYEGGVCDRNAFLTGATPAQQAEILIPAAMKAFNGKKAYVLAADYNYGQYMARWFQKLLQANGGSAIATEFFPLDVSDFNSTIKKIQDQKPDFLISALVGGAHLSFYRQWAAAGLKGKIPIASTTLGVGNEHMVLTPTEGDGILLAYNYSKDLDTPASKAFVSAWKGKYGDDTEITEMAVSQYQTTMLWAAAVRKAGSTQRDAVTAALEGPLSIDAPSGKLSIDPQTHHAVIDVHLMEVRNQRLAVKQSFAQRGPVDTLAVCDLKKNPADNKQYDIKI